MKNYLLPHNRNRIFLVLLLIFVFVLFSGFDNSESEKENTNSIDTDIYLVEKRVGYIIIENGCVIAVTKSPSWSSTYLAVACPPIIER